MPAKKEEVTWRTTSLKALQPGKDCITAIVMSMFIMPDQRNIFAVTCTIHTYTCLKLHHH